MENIETEAQKALSLINGAQRILIVPSSPVDADALGSGLALQMILRKLGKSAIINYSFEHIQSLKFLPGTESIKIQDLFSVDFSQFDLLVFLDGGILSQFYDRFSHRESFNLPTHPPSLNIDHHLTNEGFATQTLHRLEVSSTAQIVYELFKGRVVYDAKIATNLLAGISTDTGHFRYGYVTPEVWKIAASLLESGVDLPGLVRNLFYTTTAAAVRFAGYLCQKIEINESRHYGFFAVDFRQWQKFNLTYEEFRDGYHRALEGSLTSIGSLDFVFVISEREPGNVGISFRGRRGRLIDLIPVAKSLGGGGHPAACGAKIFDRSVDEVLKMVESSIEENYERIKIKK